VPAPRPDLRATPGPARRVLGVATSLALPTRPAEGDSVDLGPDAADVGAALGLDLAQLAGQLNATGKAGEVLCVPVAVPGLAVEQVLLAGVGDGSTVDLRRAAAGVTRRCTGQRRLALAFGDDADESGRRAIAEAIGLAGYTFTRRGEGLPENKRPVRRVDLLGWDDADAALTTARATVAAVTLARDLGNATAAELTPATMARRAEAVAASSGLRIKVRDHQALAREGFGGLIGVGSGSVHPPALIELRYRPRGADASTPHVVLVGKGITFDTGGLSLKPSAAMVPMKTDMAASAAVLAVMSALRDLDVRVFVTGLMAMAENMPSGSATRPGDVLTHYDGRTTEVLNTDAEGRLVLADALSYAAARLDPDVVIDLATLTGAVTVALGRRVAGLFANDDALADALAAAGSASGEALWRLPLIDDYRYTLDSPVADQANIGRDPHLGGGAIAAALFLQPFVGEVPWAHLDIAGPARADADADEVSRGATGFGTRLLLRWLEDSCTD
jgi:leucyl aminopeptidase